MAKQGKYTYRVVSNNGAGTYGGDWLTFQKAKESAFRLSGARVTRSLLEIERVETLPNGAHRYCMRQGSHWVPWNAQRDAEQRKPDFSAQYESIGGKADG